MRYEDIPMEIREQVREWIRHNHIRELWVIHERYHLTDYDYSCCGLDGMMEWFRDGLEKGLI